MTPGQLCALCQQEIAKHTCKLCGALVGDNCYDKAEGLCVKCKQGKTITSR